MLNFMSMVYKVKKCEITYNLTTLAKLIQELIAVFFLHLSLVSQLYLGGYYTVRYLNANDIQ